ncbi:hypothetical protein BASA50_002813 [Batrachochytrium salamandrivorans]|uniref:Transcription initiation factor IIA subunit 1 n=1 Tax=Batrachochytrium salamandrivorans TaxID=1357716 RepID=A0ABQ8FKL8_9FUNG|nr:hypothetical protein BASA60_011061 [Batrachochytrium salamandrivorans]KAH6570679.1 hypothetical protein BASA62_004257 [Batrachochytrium salamandrivorans]KAH6595885.1 hypothetical protein BASA61_003639 [Batrachochytrium salamandrivorans]KAH6599789.1 hypothetical protein BASA50_002813 [Batrachochytrium salamandrivorans]KAH9252741.1 hypothetical protein BASA81_009346 [Batrachochytrium salamandrivorans]
MSNNAVPGVYKWVMDDVINKMSQRFAELGMDVNVLSELQQTWEAKIVAMGVAPFAPVTQPVYPPQAAFETVQPNGQYGVNTIAREDGLYEYGSPANLAALANTGIDFHLPQNDGPADEDINVVELRNAPVLPLPTQSDLNADLAVGSTSIALASNIQSTDRLNAQTLRTVETDPCATQREVDEILLKAGRKYRQHRDTLARRISQVDGVDDEEDDDDDVDEAPGGGDTSDIDSELDDDDSEDEYAEVDHLVLCQFEKVQRVKNKWKCVLKDGVVNVNGKDYLFNKANCDFEW